MISEEKFKEMKAMFDLLCNALPDEPDEACFLTDKEITVLDLLSWIIDDTEKPKLD